MYAIRSYYVIRPSFLRVSFKTKVEPPIITAAVPLFLELSAIKAALAAVTFSGSIRVIRITSYNVCYTKLLRN